MEALQYPIGRFTLPAPDASRRTEYTSSIGRLPSQLEERIGKLEAGRLLDRAYRTGGWTAQQVIHHLADSHVHAYRRHRVTLLEDHPTLVTYDEQAWARLPDVQAVPVRASLDLLRGLHLRWAVLLTQCTDAQWLRTAYHPGSKRTYTLETLAAQYDWHGRHHLAHLDIIIDGVK